MKNIFKVLCFLVLATVFTGCPKDDSITAQPPKPYAEQKPIDDAAIDDFLATHYVTVDAEFNTTFELIGVGGTETPIKDMPNLEFKMVDRNDLTYKLYYLNLNEGIGEQPIKVDSAFVSYKGTLFNGTVFDTAEAPVWFMLQDVIPGWGEIVPEFKAGESIENPDGTVTYQNYGAGVMFLPSSFAYYGSSIGAIPAYAPLIFNFKLIGQKHIDHDSDRVLSVYEYYDPNPSVPIGTLLDTDGDDVPDYLDVDDDNDGTITKEEIKYFDTNGNKQYYEFANIPTCNGGILKKHLDPSCQ